MGGGPPQNSDLKKLVKRLAEQGPFKSLETPKRIRLLYNGAFIADTSKALYVWEHEYYPQYYLPMEAFVKPHGFDVRLSHGEAITSDDGKIVGGGLEMAVRREGSNEEYKVLTEMVLFAADLEGPALPLRNYVKVMFNSVDQWFEEDTPIYVHPKDPYKRVDCLQSMKPIRVTIPSNGVDVVLAESATSVHLYETMLPPRYYLPYTSLRTTYLQPSTTTTECPYKGVAQYHDIVVDGRRHEDLVWWYRAPTAECIAVTGLRCFYNEKVDIWMLEGSEWIKQERVQSHFA
ncbi:hypothetical protein PMZ80_004492 [Knufia obscura]|uniref:DUF427 domain-containing protein n=1 Tax=Knufia obscura TaxID=1635080 RepID=A0ABR0RS97_9EURO|nr:hypothetical protein PMZ80_004492 [Knufia obscura]